MDQTYAAFVILTYLEGNGFNYEVSAFAFTLSMALEMSEFTYLQIQKGCSEHPVLQRVDPEYSRSI
jgi:hypothetical protein